MTELFRPIIKSFPKDGQVWRLDWFGDLFYSRQERFKQPFIRLVLSKTDLNPAGTWDYPAHFSKPIQQRRAAVPVSMLPILSIGSLWRDGELIIEPDFTREAFSLEISQTSCRLIKAGVDLEEQCFLLPFELHPYHRDHTHSYCLQVDLADGRHLLIPALELFRFYFGSSSTMIARMCSPPFDTSNFWRKAQLDPNGIALVDLAEGLSGHSATDIARIALSPAALYAAKVFTNSLITAGGTQANVYPKMIFPFTGKTNLAVKGVWLGKTFLAFQVLSCGHPFPFVTLQYTLSKNQTRTVKKDESQNGSPEPALMSAKRDQNSKKGELQDKAPDNQSSPKQKSISNKVRFPDLVPKYIYRTDPVTPVRLVFRSGAVQINGGIASGEGERPSEIKPIELVNAADLPDPLKHVMGKTEFGQYVVAYTDRLKLGGDTVWFAPLDDRQKIPQFSLMPEIVNEDGEIHPLSFIEAKGFRRNRYLSVIVTKGEIYLVHLLPEGVEVEGGEVVEIVAEVNGKIDLVWVGEEILRAKDF